MRDWTLIAQRCLHSTVDSLLRTFRRPRRSPLGLLGLAAEVLITYPMATTGYIALFGEFLNERLNLTTVAREFSWATRQSTELSSLEAVDARTPLVGVLIHPKTLALPWMDALRVAQATAPQVRAVICHDLDDLDFQPEMTTAGAFYTLLMPIDSRELRFLFAELAASLSASAIPKKGQDRPRLAARMAQAG